MLRYLLAASLMLAFPSAAAADHRGAPPTTVWPTSDDMTAIFDADQKARQTSAAIDWARVGKEDEQRRVRTQALLDAGALQSGEDFFHAAFVFQHGGTSDDYLKAHLLAIVSIARGNANATWIAAATLDRYLRTIGQPQILGTQFITKDDGRTTQEPFNRALLPDALRAALGVPGLRQQEQRRKDYEKTAAAQAVQMVPPPLKPAPSSPPARQFSGSPGPVQCPAIPGAEAILQRRSVRWVVVGEMHGTNETPGAFADLVCLASRSRPVAVAVEQSADQQPAIDDFIGSDGGAAATARFLESAIWTLPTKDGRSSEADFRLFQRLRDLRVAGRITSVVAVQPLYTPGPAGFSPADYENAMAATLIAKVPPMALTLVLVGNVHARQTAIAWSKPAYLAMAGYLPAGETITLDARWNGGSYWACTSATDCGARTVVPGPEKTARGITEDAPGGPYFGALNLGVAATFSPPQRAAGGFR